MNMTAARAFQPGQTEGREQQTGTGFAKSNRHCTRRARLFGLIERLCQQTDKAGTPSAITQRIRSNAKHIERLLEAKKPEAANHCFAERFGR